MSDDVGVSMWTGPKCWSRGSRGDASERKSGHEKGKRTWKEPERSQKIHHIGIHLGIIMWCLVLNGMKPSNF
jgi:hypothetical protein